MTAWHSESMNDELMNATPDIHDGWKPQPQIQEQERSCEYNEAQRQAIGCEAPVAVVEACAGSGKTRTIIGRVLHGPCVPDRTAICTFTNAAARVIQERLAEHNATVSFAGTIHAWMYRLIRQYHSLVGYGDRISILDADAADTLLRSIIAEQRYKGTLTDAQEAVKRGPLTGCKLLTPEEIVAAAYFRNLKSSNLLDFDSILRVGLDLLRNEQVIREWQWDDCMIDEFQDATGPLYSIFKALPAKRVMVIGDHCQAIYSFMGSSAENIKTAETGATVIRLPLNYRCASDIICRANELIKHNGEPGDMIGASGERGRVILFDGGDEKKEACLMANNIHSLLREDPEMSIAVLVRTNEHRRQISDLLEGFGVQVEKKVDTIPPRDWSSVKALLAALADPDNTMACENLIRAWKPAEAQSIIDAAVANLQSLNESCLHLPYLDLATDAVAYISQKKPSEESLKRLTDAMALSPGSEATIADLQLALAESHEQQETLAGGVIVSTYHSFKGRESDAIFMPAMEMGMFPSEAEQRTTEAMAEAVRLCYVGVTRARKYLFLSWAGTRKPLWGGKTEPTEPSVFLKYMGFKT